MQYADFATYAIACAIVCSHINGIPITVQVYSVHCWPRKYSMSRFESADTLRPYSNVVSKMHRFRDMATYGRKSLKKLTPLSFGTFLGGDPFRIFRRLISCQKLKLGAIISRSCFRSARHNTGCDRRTRCCRNGRATHSVARLIIDDQYTECLLTERSDTNGHRRQADDVTVASSNDDVIRSKRFDTGQNNWSISHSLSTKSRAHVSSLPLMCSTAATGYRVKLGYFSTSASSKCYSDLNSILTNIQTTYQAWAGC